MRSRSPYWIPLLLLATLSLVSATVAATSLDSRPQPQHRSLFLSGEPTESEREIRVAARTSTTLRFEIPPSPSLTNLGGWEARFEPLLVGGSTVVIVALNELSSKDRVPLTVTLMDGTVLPFTLVPAQETVDTQVDVFLHTESILALQRALKDEREAKEKLQARLLLYQQEALSTKHALATLVLNNAFHEKVYKLKQKWTFQESSLATDIKLVLLPSVAPGYAAAIFTISNRELELPWTLGEVRLTNRTTGQREPCAVRMHSPSIAPGQTGQIVIVTSLHQEQTEPFLLEVFRKDGLREFALIDLNL